jgi:hypothetical protein
MKSQIHKFQKNNFKRVSKNLVFTIGSALLAFTNVNAGNVVNATEVNSGSKVHDTAIVCAVSLTGEETVLEAIAQDVKVTETTVEAAAPLLPGKSPDEVIADDNLVIDGRVNKEILPLDFNKINGVEKKAKKRTIKNSNERLVGTL